MVTREIIDQVKTIKIDKSKGSMYNSWRSKVYSKKGKEIGFPDSWKTFKGFQEEMSENWEQNKILCRININLPYSKENCHWVSKGSENISKLSTLNYNGETKTLIEWCQLYDLNYNGVRQRYYKGKNYSPEEILFGKILSKKMQVQDVRSISDEQNRRNKISKMCSAYKCKDAKHGWYNNITPDYLSNILYNGKRL